MAPRAHLAIYKVCTLEGCLVSDILVAMDTAVSDGVDVLSISIGGDPTPFFQDGLAVGAFGAIEHGVFVSCAAGNSGPFASSLSNEAPWILTVAASTMDRRIISTVQLGNGLSFDGESLNQAQSFASGSYPLVYAGASGNTDAAFCGNTSFDGFDVRGKIVLCERGGDIGRIDKGVNVQTAGGFGMILMNQVADGFSTLADPHVLPASHVSYSDGLMIKTYIRYSTLNATASFSFKGTEIGTTPAPAITSFSSRGPSIASPGILKPDITGPGVSVLAAWPSLASSNSSQVIFNMISGTSMSTPHLSGIAALIKAAHPDWSPAAIKSAMMTTADIMDRSGKPIVDERHLPANLFAVGAGHVNPVKASDPGLVYDLKPDDYIPYLCGLGYNSTQVSVILNRRIDCSSVKTITEGELNYPSFSVAFIDGKTSITFERTVKNVGEAESTFYVKVDVPGGVYVTVQPNELRFAKTNEEMKFKVTFNKSNNISDTVRYSQGYLNWISGKHTVRSPISVAF
ncbi:hypothetical protein J5N97_024075 [Dioscorea zingiberensis]|uniref:Uncharacterized protein n=1 Tax=Dioscorea zingiberensis TaxID=325984 RepID=A0A9D5H8I2_9LILI|nr:hypothetical protein J5N97_024075 [Dioscorea zingiberensis]